MSQNKTLKYSSTKSSPEMVSVVFGRPSHCCLVNWWNLGKFEITSREFWLFDAVPLLFSVCFATTSEDGRK